MQVDLLASRIVDQIVAYLPSAIAGLLLLALGLLAAWVTKRIVVQTLVVLRFHRILVGFHWGRALRRVDVRLSLYNLFGDLCGLAVFLVLLNAALTVMKLTVVSELISKAVILFPRAAAALLILGGGWLLAAVAANGVRGTLERENVARSRLVASYVRAMLLVFFSAMALAELNISRDVVLIGFTVAFATLGAVTVVLVVRGAGRWFEALPGAGSKKETEQAGEPDPNRPED